MTTNKTSTHIYTCIATHRHVHITLKIHKHRDAHKLTDT